MPTAAAVTGDVRRPTAPAGAPPSRSPTARTYTWAGSATGTDGSRCRWPAPFATVTPARRSRGTLNIGDDRTVGIAAPIRIQFNEHVERPGRRRTGAVGDARRCRSRASWGWLPDEGGGSRVDYRPKEYWPAGTTVTVARQAVRGGLRRRRATAQPTSPARSRIGRAQIVKADVKQLPDGRHPGRPAGRELPGQLRPGLRPEPQHPLRRARGQREVHRQADGQRALRLRPGRRSGPCGSATTASSSTPTRRRRAAQGSSNVTHGCVNLSPADAKAYYDTALYGDPVEVTGTAGRAVRPRTATSGTGRSSWEQWKALSAL